MNVVSELAEVSVWLQFKVSAQKKEEDEEEGTSRVICERCGRSDRVHQLLVCVRCDSGYDFRL